MLIILVASTILQCITMEDSILALGDSYTIGEGVEENDRWPVQMVKQLNDHGESFSAPKIIAKTGWTTDELEEGIKQHELAEKYDWVTLLIGVNNQYRGRDVDEYKKHFRGLLNLAIKKAGNNPKHVIVLSIPDWGVTPFAKKRNRDPVIIAKQIDQFNQVNREVAEELAVHYLDVTKLTRDAANEPSRFLVADELHPSAEMYKQWARLASQLILNQKD